MDKHYALRMRKMPHETQTFRTNFPFLYVRIKIRRDFANLSFILVQMAHFMSYRRFVIKDAFFSRVLCHMRINDSIVSTKEYFISILSWQIEAVNEFTYRRPIAGRSFSPNFKCGIVGDCAFFTKTRRQLNVLNHIWHRLSPNAWARNCEQRSLRKAKMH